MKKGNVIDLIDYRGREKVLSKAKQIQHAMSKELEIAIQQLIHRLRVLGPLENK